jgi:hypothetical protein
VRCTLAINIVRLIRGEEDRLPTLAKQLSYLGVARVWAGRSIYHQDDEVRVGYGHARLILYCNVNDVALRRLHPPRVNESETETVPVSDCDQSIARSAGAILYNGTALSNEAIE